MSNNYSSVIDILMSEKTDFKALVIDIAKTNPSIVKRAAINTQKLKIDWREKCKKLRDSEGLVAAVKFCRNETGINLKDAVETVKSL